MQILYLASTFCFRDTVYSYDWKDTISGIHVSQGSAETLVRTGGGNKFPFDSILSQQHLCRKLPKFVLDSKVLVLVLVLDTSKVLKVLVFVSQVLSWSLWLKFLLTSLAAMASTFSIYRFGAVDSLKFWRLTICLELRKNCISSTIVDSYNLRHPLTNLDETFTQVRHWVNAENLLSKNCSSHL